MLALVDALNILDAEDQNSRPIPLSMCYCTKDGELITYEKIVKSNVTRFKSGLTGKASTKVKRKPNHTQNATRNVRVVGTDQVRKISIYQIISVNNINVII